MGSKVEKSIKNKLRYFYSLYSNCQKFNADDKYIYILCCQQGSIMQAITQYGVKDHRNNKHYRILLHLHCHIYFQIGINFMLIENINIILPHYRAMDTR